MKPRCCLNCRKVYAYFSFTIIDDSLEKLQASIRCSEDKLAPFEMPSELIDLIDYGTDCLSFTPKKDHKIMKCLMVDQYGKRID